MLRSVRHRGMTLVELLVSLSIAALLMMAAAPSVGTWIRNSQIRTIAEAVQNGLQLAKAEAVRRNQPMRFQLVSSLTGGCALSNTGPDWVISRNDPSGQCDQAPSEDVAPFVLQRRAAAEGSTNILVQATQSSFVFNALGRATNVVGGATVTLRPNNGTCAAAGGDYRCLQISITPSGAVRMCDPAVTSADDPRRCLP